MFSRVEDILTKNPTIPQSRVEDLLVQLMNGLPTDEHIRDLVGSPLKADTVSEMTDDTKIYIYTGSETGYTAGHWYYYNGSFWADGGVYNSAGINTDKTLSVEDKAADGKAVGDELTDLKSDLNQTQASIESLVDASTKIVDSDESGVDLDISDMSGNVILRLENGEIKTKSFSSADIILSIRSIESEKLNRNHGAENAGKILTVDQNGNAVPQDAQGGGGDTGLVVDDSDEVGVDLDISDQAGYVVMRLQDGHLKTKNFNSQSVLQEMQNKLSKNQGIENSGKYLAVGGDGQVTLRETDMPTPAIETFSVVGNFVNGTALNLIIGEKFNKGDHVLFHVEDGFKNYESGALATYYENANTIVASRRGSNGYLEHVVTEDEATLSIRIPASGYDDSRQVTLYIYRVNGEVKPKIVTVSADGFGMFSTLRGAIDSITDASSYINPYEIWIYPGTYDVLADYTDEEIAAVENPYTQTSFVGPKLTDGISIKGVGGNREDIVLTATLDPNKWGTNVRGQVSTLNTQGSGSVENLTILAYNMRYCVHDDFRNPSNQKTWRVLRNLTFGGSLTNTPKFSTYGAGMSTPRDYLIEDCDFVYTLGIHGNTNYSFPCHITLNRCSGYAFVIGDYADEDSDSVVDVEVNDCNFERIYINAHTSGLTKPHVRLYGVGNEHTMVSCSSLYKYVFGNIITIEPGFTPGDVVSHTLNTDMFALTSNWEIATGIVVASDDEHSYVQRCGYVCAELINLSGLSIGDYVTIDQNTKKVIIGTANNAIGCVVWIDAQGGTMIKLRR